MSDLPENLSTLTVQHILLLLIALHVTVAVGCGLLQWSIERMRADKVDSEPCMRKIRGAN